MKIYTENFTILLNKHITNKEIDTYEFRVMCYLLMLSDNDGTCYPSYKTIADRIDISETKAKDSIKKLIDLGLIKKEKRKKADGSATSNLYVVCEKTTVKVDEATEDMKISQSNCRQKLRMMKHSSLVQLLHFHSQQ